MLHLILTVLATFILVGIIASDIFDCVLTSNYGKLGMKAFEIVCVGYLFIRIIIG